MSVAVVTGASRGIGQKTALRLAGRGCDLALFGRPSPELEQTARTSHELGVRVEIAPCDLERPDDIEQAARATLSAFGPPEVIVNNAGVIRRTPIETTTLEAWNTQLDVNLRAPFLLTRALLPGMLQAGRGRIVYVGSISSTLGTANAAAYCASKWGLVGFMKSLAEELTGSGLMTVAILPGSVETRMLENSGFQPRMSAEDVASSIVHYALDAPLAHNGSVIEMFGV